MHHQTGNSRKRLIVGDTETTGLDKKRDRIIEIAGVEIIGNVITGRRFHTYINPEGTPVHEDAFKVHGISNEQLRDKPKFRDILPQYLDFIGNDTLVFHNAAFDLSMIESELGRLKRPMLSNPIEDTLIQAQKKFPTSANNLDALIRRFKIDGSNRTLHGALLDSELLAEVYIEMHGLNRLDLCLPENQQPTDDEPLFEPVSTSSPANSGLIRPPSEKELRRHGKFVDESLKNAVWKKFGEKNVDII